MACQNNLKLNNLEQTIKEHYQISERTIIGYQTFLSSDFGKVESENLVIEKLHSWNLRQIKNLGDRYNPDLNISLELTNALEGAAVSHKFQEDFLEETDQYLISIRKIGLEDTQEICNEIERIVTEENFFDLLTDNVGTLTKLVWEIQNIFSREIDCLHRYEGDRPFNSVTYQIYQGQIYTDNFINFLSSTSVKAAMSPYIVMTGDGGTGKSHLIANFIEEQNEKGQASFLLLGQQFSIGTDVLSKLPELLGCSITYHELFSTLESIALRQKGRLIIYIDALNEGAGVPFWNNTLAGLVSFVQEFSHLGIFVSVRTQYVQSLFDKQNQLESTMLHIEHKGFSSSTYDAIYRYFSFYRITTDSVLIPNNEFSNPLFLSLFCKVHQNSHIGLEDISLPLVYEQYLDYEEKQIAEKCGYPKSYKLIFKIIDSMISKRLNDQNGAIQLPLDTALKLIVDIKKQWDVSSDIYTALLSEGVLTQSMNYDGNEYVYITYERLEDYFLAERITDAFTELSKEQFVEKYNWIMSRPDLLQFVAIILSEKTNCEVFDVFSSEAKWEKQWLRNAFLYGLLWRKASSFTTKTEDFIKNEILNHNESFCQFIDVLFALSSRSSHPLNAQYTFRFFRGIAMPDRDAIFIPIFDKLYNNSNSALYLLLKWGLEYSRMQNIPLSVTTNFAIVLCWLLISSNNELRDKATKALICILNLHIDALLFVVKEFEKIDDPYISERLYCVAFGCVVNESSPEQVRKLAEYVYSAIFDQDLVYPNILLRTYAKNIVDYACYIGCVDDSILDLRKTLPPYSSKFPKIPSDDEIKSYKFDYKSPGFSDYYWGQNDILDSMKVEYSRNGQPGGYGDFGRYIFQAYFHSWRQLHPMDLKNIAIKRIFELGYDVEKHGHYDRYCPNDVRVGTQPRKLERIGKKYQWIALYELAAQVSDNYEMLEYATDSEVHQKQYCLGSFYPNVRNIDPTVLPVFIKPNTEKQRITYTIPQNTYEEWLKDFSSTPSFEECTILQHEGSQYLLLFGDFDWKESKHLGTRPYEIPQKNIWYKICGYFVRKKHTDKFLHAFSRIDLMNTRIPEAPSNFDMYNKEFYWSDANTFFKNPYYGNPDWVRIEDHSFPFKGKLMIPVRQYISERRGELNTVGLDTSSLHWYKPCEELYKNLHLRYSEDSNSLLVDTEGNPICFDSSEFLGLEGGFYIRQDKLINFLDMHDYALIWTFLSEKRILSHTIQNWELPRKAIHRSSVYFLTDDKPMKVSEKIIEDKLYF